MATALLLISFQNNFFKKKSNPKIKGVKKCAKSAARLLDYFREHNLPVVHILQTVKPEDISAEQLQPHELLEPKHEETLLVTGMANAFADDKLEPLLRSLEADHLVIAGLTAEKQIICTLLSAKELGYTCTVAQDSCAATNLKFNGEKIKADTVQKVVMAILSNSGVEISATKEFIKSEQKKLKKESKEKASQLAMQEAAKAALSSVPEEDVEEIIKKAETKKSAESAKAGETSGNSAKKTNTKRTANPKAESSKKASEQPQTEVNS